MYYCIYIAHFNYYNCLNQIKIIMDLCIKKKYNCTNLMLGSNNHYLNFFQIYTYNITFIIYS